jgi:hypothetical protein
VKRINVNMFPKSGYKFKAADGVLFTGSSWRDVIARVTDYRKRNNLPMGNVENEVHEYACLNNPEYCSEETLAQKEATRVVSLKGRVLSWLARTVKGPLKFVSQEEAKSRADICAGCPRNTAFSDGCSSCRAAVREYRKQILGGRQVDARVNGCAILGEDLPVSSHLDETRVNDSELPANCWRKAQ